MRKRLRHAFVSLSLFASTTAAQDVTIDHQAAGCVTVDRFPRLEARLGPAEQVAAARVVFQGRTADWYSVAMKPEGAVFAGVLPKPKKDLKSFRYYIEVTDKALGATRTAEFTATVVESASACKGKLMAGALASASVILQGPAGVVALPAGFASTGVVAAGTAAGSGTAVGAAGAGAGGAGGGIGTTALVIGGVAVAGGAVAAGVAKGSGDSSDSGPTGPSPTDPGNAGVVYSVTFLPALPGIDVSVCAGRPLTWGSQALSGVDAGGNFNMTWAPNEPNTLRITGQLTATNFQATLACVNGAQTGSISASGSNFSYSGTFTFGNSRGQVSISRQ